MADTVVSATVKDKAEIDDGWKLTLDVPSFKSQFPIVVYGLSDPDEAKRIRVGSAVNCKLLQGKKKQNATGDMPWHFAWRWGGLTESPNPAPQPPFGGLNQTATQDQRGQSIERQVAVKATTDLVAAGKIDIRQFGPWFHYLCTLMSGQKAIEPRDGHQTETPPDDNDLPF
jgi:hypothetical protein